MCPCVCGCCQQCPQSWSGAMNIHEWVEHDYYSVASDTTWYSVLFPSKRGTRSFPWFRLQYRAQNLALPFWGTLILDPRNQAKRETRLRSWKQRHDDRAPMVPNFFVTTASLGNVEFLMKWCFLLSQSHNWYLIIWISNHAPIYINEDTKKFDMSSSNDKIQIR